MNDPKTYNRRFSIFIFSVLSLLLVGGIIYLQKNTIEEKFFREHIEYTNLSSVTPIAKSVYILDTKRSSIVYEHDALTPRPLASVTKVMSAIVALDLWNEEEIIEATLPHQEVSGGIITMKTDTWKLSTLLKLMLTKSSNEAADALEAHARKQGIDFVGTMNEKARELQLWTAHFENPSGLDESATTPGAYASAEDASYLLRYAVLNHPEIFETTQTKGYTTISEQGSVYFVENTNKVADYLPGLIASKTGLTDLAGGNLVYALTMNDGRIMVIAILGSTKQGRFDDAEKITQALVKDFNSYLAKKQ